MKRRGIVVAIAFLAMMLIPTAGPKVRADEITYERYLVIEENCVIGGPGCCPPRGEWTIECDGTWTGSGEMPDPDNYCQRYVWSTGPRCQ